MNKRNEAIILELANLDKEYADCLRRAEQDRGQTIEYWGLDYEQFDESILSIEL